MSSGRRLPPCFPATQVHRFLVENDELVKLRSRQGLVDLEGFDLVQETSLQGVFGVKQDQLDSLCDGECEGTGLQWPLHVRERLPLDLLSCLPGAVKAVGDKRGPGSAAGGAGADADADAAGAGAATAAAGGDAGGDGADKEDGTDAATAGTMHQLRPQLQGSLFDDTAADRADALVADRAAKLGLILCASLLENLPNLAGLCRWVTAGQAGRQTNKQIHRQAGRAGRRSRAGRQSACLPTPLACMLLRRMLSRGLVGSCSCCRHFGLF